MYFFFYRAQNPNQRKLVRQSIGLMQEAASGEKQKQKR